MLFSRFVFALAVSAALFTRVEGQCLVQSAALGGCFTANNVASADELACETCMEAAILTNFNNGADCAAVNDATCTAMVACPCPAMTCEAEKLAYATCEINEERADAEPAPLDACPALDCSATPAATATTAPAPTDPPAEGAISSTPQTCLGAGAALGGCFETNQFGDAAETACETCIESAILAEFTAAECDAVCGAVTACDCGDAICVDEIDFYVTCETNKERTDATPALAACPADFTCFPAVEEQSAPTTTDADAPAPVEAPTPASAAGATTPAPTPASATTPAPTPASAAATAATKTMIVLAATMGAFLSSFSF